MKKFLLLFLWCLLARSSSEQAVTATGNLNASGQVGVNSPGQLVVLVSISVSPPNPTIAVGNSQSFTALGTFSDGSTMDVTSVSAWTSSNNSVATNSGPNFTCDSRGIVTVTATDSAIPGTTTLTCESPTFTPQGTFTVTQSSSASIIQTFTAGNGTSPYTFSSSDLPSWLVLESSAGGTSCISGQVNCLLYGTPAALGLTSFHVQLTDNLGNIACVNPGCPIAVNVVAAGTEDNIYCSSSGSPLYTETVTGLSDESTAIIGTQMLQACNNTGIANTPATGGQSVLVCPQGEKSGGVAVPGCAALPTPPLAHTQAGQAPQNCVPTGGTVYCETIQDAWETIAQSATPCGNTIKIYATIDDTNPLSAQNVYTENVSAYENVECGPDHSQPWNWINTTRYSDLPAPGVRISPAWSGQTSIFGRPNYTQTTDFGVPAGIYLPMWRCELLTAGGCPGFTSAQGGTTAATTPIIDGLRIMGVYMSAPHGRNSQTDIYGNHVCPSNGDSSSLQWDCSPGYVGAFATVGCNFSNPKTGFINCDNSSTGFPGSRHIIFDRDLFACDNIAVQSNPPQANDCYDTAESWIAADGGQHISVIESYLLQAVCLQGIGACVDSHAITGGNPPSLLPGTGNDAAFKIVDNYIEAGAENTFIGGGNAAAGVQSTDWELRRNDRFKPLTWLGVPLGGQTGFPGVIYDAFAVNSKFGSGYHLGTTCSADPPQNGTTAQCTPILALDTTGITYEIVDVLICPTAPCSSSSPAGSGYGTGTKGNGNTFATNPNFYFTDASTTYSTCANQLSGTVTSQIVSSVQQILWAHGNKFISGMVGTQITITLPNGGGTTNYTVNGFVNNKTLTISTTLTTQLPAGQPLATYASNLATRGDCFQPLIALFNIKNPGEYKNGIRILHEGDTVTNNWNGQSDQDGSAFLITPKNASNGCPTCQVTDLVERYNLYRNIVKGIVVGIAPATRGASLPFSISRVSIHDVIFDGMNSRYWSSGSSPVSNPNCVNIANANSAAQAVNAIYVHHITCVPTLPNGTSASGGSGLSLLYDQYLSNLTTPAILQNIIFDDNITPGGVKDASQQSQGLLGCQNNTCGVTHGSTNYGPTETALRQVLTNDWLTPVSGSNYTGGIVTSINLSNGLVTTDGAGNMTWVSGQTWASTLVGQTIYINGAYYSVLTAPTSTTATISPAAGVQTGVPWTCFVNANGSGCPVTPQAGSCNPSACSVSSPGGSGSPAKCKLSTTAGAVHTIGVSIDPGSGYTAIPTISFSGGTCGTGVGVPTALAFLGGVGNPKISSACFDHNAMPTAAWNGEVGMSPFPSQQIDPANNTCAAPSGGHINTDSSGHAITVDTWAKVGFVGFDGATVGVDANGAECNGINGCAPPDLHLKSTSPFHNAGNDGLDFGANIDLVLGTEAGAPSQYTGCFITGGTYQCPRQ